MHFTLTVALPDDRYIYNFLEPYCDLTYEWNDNGEIIGPDGTVYKHPDEAPFTFFDWFVVGGRWDGYIKGKRGSYPEYEFTPPKDYPEINWKRRGSAFIKEAIKGFGFDDKELSKYPKTYSYMGEDGEYHQMPEHYEFLIKKGATYEEDEYDEEAFEEAKRKYYKDISKWYKSIPDDYVIYIIDYHI